MGRPRTPTILSPSFLRAYRAGARVAVVMGAATGIPERQPRGYQRATARRRSLAMAGSTGSPAPASAQVGVVSIIGVLEQRSSFWSCGETAGYDTIEQDVCEALADPGLGSLVIRCDSPGGDVPGLEETTRRIRAVADGVGKPVLGYADECIASAAVHLMVGICDRVFLPPMGRMGSVASCVIFQTEARALEANGIDTHIARGLPGKMNPNPFEPLDAVGKARLEKIAREDTDSFIAFVAQRRGLDPAVVRGWNADLFTGAAAVDAGLADGIGSLDETITLAAELAALRETA